MPTSLSPAFGEAEEEEDEEDADPTALPPTPPSALYGGGSNALKTVAADTNTKATSSSPAASAPSSLSPALQPHDTYRPPVYSPDVPDVSTKQGTPPSSPQQPATAPRVTATYRQLPPPKVASSPAPPSRGGSRAGAKEAFAGNGMIGSYDDNSGSAQQTSSSSLALTPEQRKQLRALLDAQERQQKRQQRGASYWGRVWEKRREIAKLIMLAFVILFALSFNSAVLTYIDTYLDAAGGAVPAGVEALLRFGYPVAVVLIIWLIKVHVSSAPSATTPYSPQRAT